MKTAIQLYTLRKLDEPLERTIERVGNTNYGGVEFAGLGDASTETIASTLESEGLDAVSAHVGIDELDAEYDDVVDTYGELGCSRIVVPSYEEDAFASEEGVDAAADHLSELAERLEGDGFELLYHNHAFEFQDLGDGTAMDRLVDQTSDLVGLEIDVGLAKHAGQDPVDLLQRYADRTSLLHLTDTRYESRNTLHVELGSGVVDLGACLEASRNADVEWTIFEHGQTTDPLETLSQSDATVSSLLRE